MSSDVDELDGLSGDEKILQEAKSRFKRCEEWEAIARERFVLDIKFANADRYNGWQWPEMPSSSVEDQQKVMLTINKVRQHNLQIMNDARQNKPSVSIKPTGNGATFESAQVYEGVIRHIEYISNAQVAYDTATRFQVQGGLGYLRVATDYANEDSFDQEIFIRRVEDPLSIYIDPDHKDADAADARFGFQFNDMPRDQFNLEYPAYKDEGSVAALGNATLGNDGWIAKDLVRIAEYYRIVEKADELIHFTDPSSGEQKTVKRSLIGKQIADAVLADPNAKKRTISVKTVEWYLIVGDKIAERKIGKDAWVGTTIPIIPVTGETTVIDGILDRRGHTRAMLDPQSMYNYWSSAAVASVAMQNNIPYLTPVRAIEGLETYWANANVTNPAYLPYNDMDEKGQPIEKPERQNPPVMATAFMNGMKIASDEIQAASGQYQAELGMPSNERSGVAIEQRQRQGDNATYHYIDHLGIAIRRVGKILIEIIPKIYDTPRVIRIMGEDGTEKDVTLDPSAQQAYQEQEQKLDEAVQSIFNPAVGKYDVQADIGPSYGTQRQEAFNAFSQIIAQNKDLTAVVGDLLFRNADFPGAEELAERLKRMVPPQALGVGPSPQEQQMQMQIQHLTGLLNTTVQQLGDEKRNATDKAAQKEVDMYNAFTNRLKVIEDHLPTPKLLMEMAHDLAMQEHAGNLDLAGKSVDAQFASDAAEQQADLAPQPDAQPAEQPQAAQ